MAANKILITGGAGFIGTNASKYFAKKGYKVIVYDNLSRRGAKQNLKHLKDTINFDFVKADIRNKARTEEVFKKYKPDFVLHLAAQVTMVTSVENPREDFEINAIGTFNILEALRRYSPKSTILYSSTNKVYGQLNDLKLKETKKRYDYKNIEAVDESRSLDFHGPYGCSKGCADQYTLDFSRIYGLNSIVFRQSGIYGPSQFGIEEQGWLAWFVNAILFDKKVTIYGDGKQVRDVLYIDDVLKAYDKAFENIKRTNGKAYNIGGGKEFSISIWQLIDILEKLSNKKIKYKFGPWRDGDQKIYISDFSKAKKEFGWSPKISCEQGIESLFNWCLENKSLIEQAKVFDK